MAEQEREFVVDSAFAIMQVSVANAASLNRYDCLAWPWIGHHDCRHFDWRTLATRNDTLDVLWHVTFLWSLPVRRLA